MKGGRFATSIAVLLLVATVTRASDPIAILSPSDVPAGWDTGFGMSVAISGDWLVVGAPSDPWYNGDETGAAYVFRRVGARWLEHQKLLGFGGFQDRFGAGVAIDGDWMIVAAPGDSIDCCTPGKVLVLRRDDASTPTDPTDDLWNAVDILNLDLQISSADIANGVIVVGARGGEYEPGRVYIFHWDGIEWVGPQTIVPADSEPGDEFGAFVRVNRDVIAVAAPRDTYSCPAFERCQGSAYVFRRGADAWTEEGKLMPEEVPGIGASIDVFAGSIGVGGWEAVHIFVRDSSGWRIEALLRSSEPLAQGFGLSIALNGNRALIGSPYDHEQGSDAGSAFLFRRDDEIWSKINKLTASDLTPGAGLGRRVALDDDWAVLGGWGNRAYVYRVCEGCGTLREFADFQVCFGEQVDGKTGDCRRFDLEPDGLVDLRDLPMFLLILRGPE